MTLIILKKINKYERTINWMGNLKLNKSIKSRLMGLFFVVKKSSPKIGLLSHLTH